MHMRIWSEVADIQLERPVGGVETDTSKVRPGQPVSSVQS